MRRATIESAKDKANDLTTEAILKLGAIEYPHDPRVYGLVKEYQRRLRQYVYFTLWLGGHRE